MPDQDDAGLGQPGRVTAVYGEVGHGPLSYDPKARCSRPTRPDPHRVGELEVGADRVGQHPDPRFLHRRMLESVRMTSRVLTRPIHPERLHRHLDVNVVGPVLLTQALAPALAESTGNVVTVASISALMGQPYNTMYCASKGAVLLAMRALAVELAGRGIRVNCVSPGGIDTAMAAGAAHSIPADVDWNLTGT